MRKAWRGIGSLDALSDSVGYDTEDHRARLSVEDLDAVTAAEAELGLMTPKLRDAFLAWADAHPDGWTCREVARRYGRSPAAVGKWAAKALRRLQSVVGGP